MQKMTPFLWFDDQAEEAAGFYVSVFRARRAAHGGGGESRILGVSRYGDAGPGTSGSVMTDSFELDGLRRGGPTVRPATDERGTPPGRRFGLPGALYRQIWTAGLWSATWKGRVRRRRCTVGSSATSSACTATPGRGCGVRSTGSPAGEGTWPTTPWPRRSPVRGGVLDDIAGFRGLDG